MAELEKVIEGFRCCHVMVHDMGPDKTSCGICPYKDVQTEEQIDLGGIECIAVLHDDALALLKEQEEQIDTQRRNLMILLNEPRIVRCKDCEHATITTDGEYCKYCENYTDENGDPIEVYHDADWFCADGERKEGR